MKDPIFTRREWLGAALLTALATLTLSLRRLGPAPPPWRTHRVALNAAEPAELRCVPGIGRRSAAAIVSARPFARLEELEPLLGPARFRRARPHLVLAPCEPAPESP